MQDRIDLADFALGQSPVLHGKTMPSERPRHRLFEQRHPIGVVGVITAFNFPVAVWAWNALLAAVCGNATVGRPSPETTLAAIAVQKLANGLLREMALPPVFTLLVEQGHEFAPRIARDTRVALVSFTGSSAAGRALGAEVVARFGRVLLECSGDNAVIVDETADLALAVRATSCSVPRERAASAAPARAGCSCTGRSSPSSCAGWCMLTGSCASASLRIRRPSSDP